MSLTARTKWLTGIAAAIAAWVFFGPRAPDSIEATQDSVRPTHSARTVISATSRPISGALQRLAQRVTDPKAAGSLFATHSWYVPPPPPPVTAAPAAAPQPIKPTAPPLPFEYIGSYAPEGAQPVFFLTNGDRVYDVRVGDSLDNVYSVDSFANGVLFFTYKPLNQQQQLNTGGAP